VTYFQERQMTIGQLAVYVCWGALAVVWLMGAAAAPRVRGESGVKPKDTASRAAGVVAVAILLSPHAWWERLRVDSGVLTAAGAVILVPATVFTLWARVRLGTMWSSAPFTQAGHQLRTDGPYGVMRHPVYAGIIAMVAGTALAQGLGRWVVLLAAVVAAVVAKASAEERLLAREFPSEYGRYRDAVPRFVPRIRSGARAR
jgi:protein-S-isoprenylcysteine O-methyltransferase Ste14